MKVTNNKDSNNNRKRCYYVAAAAAVMAGAASGFVHPVSVTTTTPKAGLKRSLPVCVITNNNNLDSEDYEQQNSVKQAVTSQAATAAAADALDSVLFEGPVMSVSNADVLLPVNAVGAAESILPLEKDLSKEMLLETISRTRPADVLADVQGTSNNQIMNQDDDGSALLLSLGLGGNATNAFLKEEVTSQVDSNIATPTFLEDVKAVLAFSEEAAAEAEASMPPELVVQLEIGSHTASIMGSRNDTTPAAMYVTSVAPITADRATAEAFDEDLLAPLVETSAIPRQEEAVPEILPASTKVGEPATKSIEAPNVAKILKFAIPAIGVWLCGPLLSLIDTSAVGIFSGTVQQAALNPAVAVTDYAALLIAFMYTGTTNMVAAAQASDRGTADKPRTARTMIGAMQMSTFVGAGLGFILFAFARPLLKAIIGNDAISPAVFAAAMKYVRIRALGMPAAAIIGSTQAACLGMQDIRSPLYVLVAAAVVNFFGDVLFVGNSHPLIGGAAGAAWATVISQYVAVAYFLRWLCKPAKKSTATPKVLNVTDAILKLTGKPGEKVLKSRRQSLHDVMESLKMTNRRRNLQERLEEFADKRKGKRIGRVVSKLFRSNKMTSAASVSAQSDYFSVRGFLENRFTPKDLFKFPNKEIRQEFAPYVVPVTTTQVGKVSGYVAMSHVVASSLGTVSMAAQQVIVSLFYCLCPIADSLSLTAQSFIPGIAEKEASTEKATALRKVLFSFLKAGAIFGGAMMAAVSAIPLLSGFFTSDPAVIGLVNAVVPLLLVFFGTHGFVCASEGLLLGQKDLGFLGKMYAFFFSAVPLLMLRVKRAALTGSRAVDLTSVWNVFVGYQVFRCAVWLVRASILQRRTNRDAANANENVIAP